MKGNGFPVFTFVLVLLYGTVALIHNIFIALLLNGLYLLYFLYSYSYFAKSDSCTFVMQHDYFWNDRLTYVQKMTFCVTLLF